MTKKELDKKFPFSGKDGECSDCEYTEHCDKILPGFNKPGKCGGPFEKDGKKEKEKKTKNEQVIRLNESQLRQIIAESIEEALGSDMSTPEGRQGAEYWMRYIMSQEDPTGGYADQWVSNNAPDYPDISWDDCYERMKKAFIAGVEYGRELN